MQTEITRQQFDENTILAALSGQEYTHLHPHLETVEFSSTQNLFNFGDAIEYVYFPLDAVVYLFTTLEDGATIETGVIGSEGILGISAVLGVKSTPCQAMVLSNRKALRIRTEFLKREFNEGGILQNLMLRYFHALYVQMLQTSACNRHHKMENRLCRWLLMMHDRNKSDDLQVTQEFISEMLGTRRPYITTAAGILQKENIIECSRGHIRILNREALEKCCCGCYEVIQEEFSNMSAESNTVH